MKKFFVQGKVQAPLTTVEQIVAKNSDIAGFWSNSSGWAPEAAADLLSRSRLDRQVSLSVSLGRWTQGGELSDGDLILAWTNLGSLVEGTLKLFLAVYYEDYKKDVGENKYAKMYDVKKGAHLVPDVLMLESLIQYLRKKELLTKKELKFVTLVQGRRNAVHSFKRREIGSTSDLISAVGDYLALLKGIDNRLPYPY